MRIKRRLSQLKKTWRIFVFGGIFCFMVALLRQNNSSSKERFHFHERGFVIKTPHCRIPELEGVHNIMYTYFGDGAQCDGGKPPLVDFNATSLFVVESARDFYGSGNFQNLSCCYAPFWRRAPQKGDADVSKVRFDKDCYKFDGVINVEEEFAQVTCKIDGRVVYRDYFSFAPLKKLSHTRIIERPLNVLVMGIDSMSRLNFIKQMPGTHGFLKSLNAYHFLGFNKIADGSFSSLIPMLTGLTVGEINGTCWSRHSYADDCQYIWKMYKKNGFITAFGDDSSWKNAFYYLQRGFRQQPTDYFYHFFNAVAERDIGSNKEEYVSFCLGSKHTHRVMLDYLKKFLDRMHSHQRHFFAFFWWNSLSQHYLKRPKTSDEDFLFFLKNLYDQDYFKDTVLVVTSNGVLSRGRFPYTYEDILGEKLPVLYVKVPEWFQKSVPNLINNMVTNTRQLVTNFDVYETLKDLANPYDIHHPPTKAIKRGYSLFEAIPDERNCGNAGIEDRFCICNDKGSENIYDTTAFIVGTFVVNYINMKRDFYEFCENLALDKVVSATRSLRKEFDGFAVDSYMITLKTLPNRVLFEARVKNYYQLEGFQIFQIEGFVTKLNFDNEESKCPLDQQVLLK